MIFGGIDIGGTNIKLAIVDKKMNVLSRGIIDTRASEGPRPAFKRIRTALWSMAGTHAIETIGVGCAGLVDASRGTLRSSPNLPGWKDAPLRQIAKRQFGVNITIDNDANSAAYGEFCAGSRRSIRHLVFITLGTGVGGGIIVDGRIVRGAANYGGEIGHTVVDPNGPRCRCGARGCLEAVLGSYGLARSTRALLKLRPSRYLSPWLATGEKLTPELLATAARRGDGVARRVFRDAGEYLGIAIASLLNIFNPESVVIGGGVSAAYDLLSPSVEKTVAKRAFPEPTRIATIERSRLGNDAAVVGAAMFARDQL